MSQCKKDHGAELPADFEKVPESQVARWRHRCAGCAYEMGRRHGEEAEERLRARVRDLTAKVKELSGKEQQR